MKVTNIFCKKNVLPEYEKATKYRNDYRVWLDYAGDYRNENIE